MAAAFAPLRGEAPPDATRGWSRACCSARRRLADHARHLLPPRARRARTRPARSARGSSGTAGAAPPAATTPSPVTAKRPSASSTSAPGCSRRVRSARSTSTPSICSGCAGVAHLLPPGLHAEDRRAARAAADGGAASGSPIGPARQRSNRSSTLSRTVAAHEDVQPVAGLDLASSRAAAAPRSSRTITLTSASRGSSSWFTRHARRSRRVSATGNSSTSAPSRRIVPTSCSGRDSAGSSVVTPSAARERLERGALDQRRGEHDEEDDVEERCRVLDALDHREGGEHDRHRAAQPGPAHQRRTRAG